MNHIGRAQIGKNGLTENFFETLKSHFNKYSVVKISVLKSAGHDKKTAKGFADAILENFGNHFTARVIGFTIVLKKWRKAQTK